MKQVLEEKARRRLGRTVLGKWCLERLLGFGGTAAVYEAKHCTGRRVAVKIMHGHLRGDSKLKRRFVREAYVVNSLEHPAVVPVHDVGVDEEGAPFLVMDLLRGRTADAFRKEAGGKLPSSRVVEIAEQLLAVLVQAHEKGIIHRDLKPANLFITDSGQLKVLDFGIAVSAELSAELSEHTKDGALLGTPSFMPPEQARGLWAEVDQQSDVWAAGATLFTLLTGETVREAKNTNEHWGLAMTAPPKQLSQVAPHLPFSLVLAVDGALAFEKANRWKSAAQMLEVLAGQLPTRVPGVAATAMVDATGDSTLSLGSVTAEARMHGPSAPPRVWKRRAAGVLVTASICGAALLGFRHSAPASPSAAQVELVPASQTASASTAIRERADTAPERGVGATATPGVPHSERVMPAIAASSGVPKSKPLTPPRVRRPPALAPKPKESEQSLEELLDSWE